MLSTDTPFSLVLFGASGHLAQLKLYPALYTLVLKKRLPKEYAIVGFARTAMDDHSFRQLVEQSIRTHMPAVTEKALTEFLTHVYYRQGQYDQVEDFSSLDGLLKQLETGWKSPVRLAYLSIPPTVFPVILKHLCAGDVRREGIPFRCIVEKPVGHDLQSFEKVLKQLTSCFREEEIYLLDHYLGKEAVRNVYYLRFANPLLERLFKNTLIHHVEITAMESVGIDGRAGYYDSTGALRDMFQSHLLEIVSLLTMRLYESEESLVASRVDALEQLYLPPATSLDDIVLRGQYATGAVEGKPVPGYREEEGVPRDSRTNTFTALRLLSRTSRWQGVPFFLRSGKRLRRKETRISILFQEPQTSFGGSAPNRLDIILQGEAGMRVHLQTKLGGTEPKFRPLILEDPLVCVGDCLPEHGLLLLEAIHGKKTWYLSVEEIHKAWRFIDPLQVHLERRETPLHPYVAGTDGPEAMHAWIRKEGAEWLT